MWAEIVLASSLVLNQTAQGFIEGWIWADPTERIENPYIVVNKGKGKGALDYHAWRLVENAGQLSAIGAAFFVNDAISLAQSATGGWLIANFCYERALNIVNTGQFFPQKSPYDLMGIKIPRKPWFDWIVLITGIGVMAL